VTRGDFVNQYRVTYDPASRDPSGAYTKDEWTSVKDIGRRFEGVILTQEVYEHVEDAYVNAALAFLIEAGLSFLRVEGLENARGQRLAFCEGSVLTLDQVGDVIRRVLREEFWCRLESPDGFVHLGWDYYMYVGVPHSCPKAKERTVELGLYLEEWDSPYRDPS
jgi:hypothetical protein